MKTDISYINKIKKLLKYILLSFIIFVSLRYIPQNKIDITDILKISSVSAISFAILDIISPSVTIKNNN